MKLSTMFGKATPAAPTDFQKQLTGFYAYTSLKKPDLSAYSSVFNVPTLVGIEVEVENITKDMGLPKFWMNDHDNSLRNHGHEFKSVPLTPEQAYLALDILWKALHKASMNKPDFSWRSSVQFHINSVDLDNEEFRRFILLYLVFEGVFFKLAGEAREQSNFCVPLASSVMVPKLRKFIVGDANAKSLFTAWNMAGGDAGNGYNKYSAVNFSRLGDLGTTEFRHLGGTNDFELISLILGMALRLYQSAVTMTTSELTDRIVGLNTTKSYSAFSKQVFGKLYELMGTMDYQDLLYETVIRTKEMLVKVPKFGCKANSALVSFASQAAKRANALKGGTIKTKK